MTDSAAQIEHRPERRRRILVISQTFIPDPAAVGQYMADVAIELARRGYEVRVIASARGYENPSTRYPTREFIPGGGGVHIRRLRFAGFGKKNILIRVIGTASFMAQVFWYQLFTPRVAGIFFSTSPPMVGVTSCIVRALRRIPIVYWAMDLNPDQLIVMDKIKPQSLVARFLERTNRFILNRSSMIVALDRYMRERLLRRGDLAEKIVIAPLWPHEEGVTPVDQAANPFREKHGLVGKRVIMYSGNHSPANPLTTLLEAAAAFKNDDRVRFLFVGGGLGKKEVDACIRKHGLTNMLSLPYQPLADLKCSLSAADIHVVSLGEQMAGIIHPCKIYGAMAVGRPVLYLGPSPSHISDILQKHHVGWQVAHGDVEGMKQRIEALLAMPQEEIERIGKTAQEALRTSLGHELLLQRMGDALEQVFPPPIAQPVAP